MRALSHLLALLALVTLAGCARPSASDFFGGSPDLAGTAVQLGTDASGEACTQQTRGGATGGADIFCGTWTQPSGHIDRGGPADAGALTTLATSGSWRMALDSRFACGTPAPTTILGSVPAVALQCARRVGGWPQIAMVASVDGVAYYGDAIEPALGVLQRGIGVVAGRVAADAATSAQRSAADGLFASRLAAQAFSAGNIAQYEQLMTAGTTLNLEENFRRAEDVFRAALALQEKALGPNDPNLAIPVMHLALQVSDEGHFAEAAGLFARATALAPRATDVTAEARLLHYRALDAMNQAKFSDALALLDQADAAYSSFLTPSALSPRQRPGSPALVLASSGSATRSDPLPKDDVILEPTEQIALIGVIEVRRNRSIVLRDLDRDAESDRAIASAAALADAHGMRLPRLTSRLFRTAAANAGAQGRASEASMGLAYSSAAFSDAFPGTRPLAETRMLHAAQLHRGKQDADALAQCRDAVALLRTLKAGVAAEVLNPCLDVYVASAEQTPADRQQLYVEMFEAAQLAQGGITSQQIASATARLVENARDPRVGAAVRRQQDAQTLLADLTRRRDALREVGGESGNAQLEPAAPISASDLDKQIVASRADLADAEAALTAASPNFTQLVQEVTPAAAVFAALTPGEAFAMTTLGVEGGYVFVLHDGQIAAAKTQFGQTELAERVKRVRAGIEIGDKGLPKFDTADAQAIYADTLGRVEPALVGVTSLTVAPAGPLLALPFGVLLTGPGDPANLAAAPWLVRRFDIAHVPAATNFVSLRKVAGNSRATRPWFGFGDFKPVTLAQAKRSFPGASCADSAQLFAGLGSLASARRELDAARALLGAAPSDEMLGASFTATNVQRASLSDYRVLHFAAHALLPAELKCADEPAIVTSDPPGAVDASGALLTASEIQNLSLDADLVILSACNSGGPGDTTGGESLSGLARSFFFAGARSMLVTHWSVNDQAAAFLVASTVGKLRGGSGIAAAMRASQLSMLDGAGKNGSPPELAHPFFWAPFAVIGESRGKIVTTGLPQHLAGL